MYEDIFESIRHAAEERNLRERTIQLYWWRTIFFCKSCNRDIDNLVVM